MFYSSEETTINSLIDDWNASMEQNIKIIQDENMKLQQDYDAKKISPHEFLAGWQPLPQALNHPGSEWSKWFLRNWGWSLLSRQSDAQASLPYDHPDMVQARAQVAELSTRTHGALIINFDQLWRASWQFGGKLLYKGREDTGKRVQRKRAPKRIEKKLHCVKGARRSITVPQFEIASFWGG